MTRAADEEERTMHRITEAFSKYDDEFLRFERIEAPLHFRPDVCAFLMLDQIAPSKRDIVSSAEHDEIWLSVDVEKVSENATDEQLRDLHRCGVRFDEENESLCMFV